MFGIEAFQRENRKDAGFDAKKYINIPISGLKTTVIVYYT